MIFNFLATFSMSSKVELMSLPAFPTLHDEHAAYLTFQYTELSCHVCFREAITPDNVTINVINELKFPFKWAENVKILIYYRKKKKHHNFLTFLRTRVKLSVLSYYQDADFKHFETI